MIFLDGVGLGTDDPAINPFARFTLPCLDRLLRPAPESTLRCMRPLDANLGVAGLPQSGTGQATLFTGKNCARIAGRHFGPFPHTATKRTLAEHNIFRKVHDQTGSEGHHSAFANAYPPPFFKMVQRRNRWTVTTRCCLDAGVRIRNLEDLEAGSALAADITGGGLARAGFQVNPVTESIAAHVLASLARQHRFTLFEYFHTDKAGHDQSFDSAKSVLESLDRFLEKLTAITDPATTTLVITSDHGNLEDLSTKSHTRNPVPLIAVGAGAPAFSEASSIVDVTPAIVRMLAG